MKQITREEKVEMIDKLYDRSYAGKIVRKLKSLNHGEIEVWNYIECNRQNAEHDGNDFLGHFESSLAGESENVQRYFRSHGINF